LTSTGRQEIFVDLEANREERKNLVDTLINKGCSDLLAHQEDVENPTAEQCDKVRDEKKKIKTS
jgi:hypothetical protein